MDDHNEQQPHRIDQDMALTSLDLFPCIISPLTSDLGRFDALAIQNGPTGLNVTSFSLTQLCSQGIIDDLPESTASPGVIIVGNCSIRREIARQIPPCAATAIQRENGVEDFPPAIFDFPTQLFRSWQQWFDQLPLQITQVTGVSFSHHKE